PGDWNTDVDRFFRSVAALDAYLASDAELHFGAQKIFQGAIADSLTHVGQINMLRRIAAAPVRGENYARADIAVGQVTREQPPSRVEFDWGGAIPRHPPRQASDKPPRAPPQTARLR